MEKLGLGLGLTVWLAIIAAYLTHIAWVVSHLANDTINTTSEIILAFSTFVPPIAVGHGFYLWF